MTKEKNGKNWEKWLPKRIDHLADGVEYQLRKVETNLETGTKTVKNLGPKFTKQNGSIHGQLIAEHLNIPKEEGIGFEVVRTEKKPRVRKRDYDSSSS
ncbi:MAG: hypothetical protein LBO09_06695 [Candidatus Peribacteria bacterium]|jgi:hypothetical protein|nr:hypothetical protein [Candidatus Peribacteria bacterium]